MPHDFDTGLVASQRRTIRDAIVARLGALKRVEDLYLTAVKPSAVVLDGTQEGLDRLREELNGQAPSMMVALGRKTFNPAGTTTARDRHTGQIEVHVYVVSANQRSYVAKVAGDVASDADDVADPGTDTMLEHVEELLNGYQVPDASESIHRLIPTDEDEVYHGADFAIWHLRYTVLVERTTLRNKGISQLVESILTTQDLEDAAVANQVIALTELD
ncbi:MAG: DUF1834 family protein [Actinomycetota bacterium]|nr:DUF1834 family protein [Actinomycetota bacterium]